MNLHILRIPQILTLALILTFISCSKDEDVFVEPIAAEEPTEIAIVTLQNEVNDFIWKGLNEIYLWQEDVPNLADTKFFTSDEYVTFINTRNPNTLSPEIVSDYFSFLNGYQDPDDLFDALLYRKDEIDKFSFMTENYIELENSFQGISTWNGVDFGLVRISGSDDIFGYVRYIAKNSDASTKNIKRGDLFLTIDGQQLNINNYRNLLFDNRANYILGMASVTNGAIELNGKTVNLNKTEFTEDPILINKVIDASGIKIGYLMYNSFTANFDEALNDAIGNFKSQGISELVLDLRYNPGGSVSSAIALASMITGQFTGKVFSREIWNKKYQDYFEANSPETLTNKFTEVLSNGTPLNQLNLSKVYILTTEGSASASELVINGLRPYIDVVQIGTRTTGKYTASVTLYDSSDFSRSGANRNHTYAIQPLVLKSANANGVTDYSNGLMPDFLITYNNGAEEGENILNMGILGDVNEPFLAKALSLITGESAKFESLKSKEAVLKIDVKNLVDTKDFNPLGKDMYIDHVNIPNRQ